MTDTQTSGTLTDTFFTRAQAAADRSPIVVSERARREEAERQKEEQRVQAERIKEEQCVQAEQQKNELRAQAERKERLETVCRESQFTAFTKAIAALPRNEGKKFFVTRIEGENGPLSFDIVNTERDWGADVVHLIQDRLAKEVPFIKFILDEENAITCIRAANIVGQQESMDGSPEGENGDETGKKMTPVNSTVYKKEEIEYTDMKQAVTEQLADWVGCVGGPDRVRELKQKMQRRGLSKLLRPH